MSTYGQLRDQQYLDRLDSPINSFISRYNANLSDKHKTVFLFPGGMGSQLIRATGESQNGPPFFYLTAWLDALIAFGTATNLQMQVNGDQDYQQHFVVPDGCVNCIDLHPYRGFIDWCDNSLIDLFVFGWDWRRGSKAAADFFLQKFMPLFDANVTDVCSPHPLDNFWLIGHSFGGIVVKQILNQFDNQYVQRMQRAITVATPFYGYGGQVHRYFKGDSQLNWTEGVDGAQKITQIVSTLPAGYELLFIDGQTYDANQAAFANDPEGYNLMKYPSMDALVAGERADPYNPQPGQPTGTPTGDVRYLSSYGFDWDLLAAGKAASYEITKPLDESLSGKLWNIRGVGKSTVVTQIWKRVPSSFDPDTDDDPVTDHLGPGDGTLPAWSTRLLGNPNVISLDDNIEHMTMMNEPVVQAEIASLLNPTQQALRFMRRTAKQNRVKTKAASRKKLNRLIRDLHTITAKEGLRPEERNVAIRERLRRYSPNELQDLMARAYIDALKSPSQLSSGRGRGGKRRLHTKRRRSSKRKRT